MTMLFCLGNAPDDVKAYIDGAKIDLCFSDSDCSGVLEQVEQILRASYTPPGDKKGGVCYGHLQEIVG